MDPFLSAMIKLHRFKTASLSCSLVCVTPKRYWYRRGYLPPDVEPGAYPFPKRQVPLCGLRSYRERIAEIKNSKGFESCESIDIGLPYHQPKLPSDSSNVKNRALETAARKRTLRLPIPLIHSASQDSGAPSRRMLAAKHYDIFNALFGQPHFFVPQVNFGIDYPLEDSDKQTPTTNSDGVAEAAVQPVYTGNFISPSLSKRPPRIDLSAAPSGYYWTLVMSCPDEPISMDERLPACNEYIHWMVSNLHHSDSSPTTGGAEQALTGDEIVPYLPPLPYQGTGYHRYIFTLYRQDNGPADFSSVYSDENTCARNIHSSRRFNTLEFYRSRQDELTPAGLAFFQSAWDDSVRQYFRNELNTNEPIFELEWPTPRLPPQERFPVANSWVRARRHPHGLPLARERYGVHNDVSFDVYLDRYRDRKELEEELILMRLASAGNPLAPSRDSVEFPNAIPLPDNLPTWYKRQEQRRRLRQGRWRNLEGHDG